MSFPHGSGPAKDAGQELGVIAVYRGQMSNLQCPLAIYSSPFVKMSFISKKTNIRG